MCWREVIHQYLIACVDDSRCFSQPTSRQHFMDEYGSTAMKLREQEIRTLLDKRAASQQVPLPDTYKVIEENPQRVITEIEKSNLMELFCTTRFLIVKVDNQWKLDDIFYSCTCTNGICQFCEGNGYCRLCQGRLITRRFFGLAKQKCFLCQGKPKCEYCEGTGRCEFCSQSPIPGWKSRTSILSEDTKSG